MHEIIRWRLCDNFVNLFDVRSGNTTSGRFFICAFSSLEFILLDDYNRVLNF